MRTIAQLLTALVLTGASLHAFASVDSVAPKSGPVAGDGWQPLSSVEATGTTSLPASAVSAETQPAGPVGSAQGNAQPWAALDVAPVVLAGDSDTSAMSFTISPQDMNLRNALDRWLPSKGWQLAWSIDDALPLEFNATFSGDFTSVLKQVMQATNHMRTPTRICRHTNHVIRVIARAASCKE